MGSDASSRRFPAPVGLGVAVAAISTAAILIREAEASALAIAFWRTAGGAVLLAPLAVSKRAEAASFGRRQGLLLAASGIFLALHFALWLGSLELTTVASSVTLVTMSPLFVAVLGAAVLDERVSRRSWVGILVTVIGAVVIGLGDVDAPAETSNALLGDLMALGGALAMAGYILIGRSMRRDGIPNSLFAVPTYGVAAAILGGVALVSGDALTDLPSSTWVIISVLVLGPQLMGHAMLTWVLDRLSATTVAVSTLLEPVGATILAWLILDEVPAVLFWIGAPVVLAGLVATLSGSEGSERGGSDAITGTV